jgi:hypothetical protein
VRLALIHLGTDEQAAAMFAKYDLADVARFSDPEKKLYAGFGFTRGGAKAFLAPRVWWRGLKGLLKGHGFGKPVGDPLQMPGAVLLENGKAVRTYRYETVADMPDFEEIAGAV